MLRRPHFWLALVALLAVIVVFIAPSVDLEPGALRAWQAACAIFLAMALSSRAFAARHQTCASRQSSQFCFLYNLSNRAPLQFSCILLC